MDEEIPLRARCFVCGLPGGRGKEKRRFAADRKTKNHHSKNNIPRITFCRVLFVRAPVPPPPPVVSRAKQHNDGVGIRLERVCTRPTAGSTRRLINDFYSAAAAAAAVSRNYKRCPRPLIIAPVYLSLAASESTVSSIVSRPQQYRIITVVCRRRRRRQEYDL